MTGPFVGKVVPEVDKGAVRNAKITIFSMKFLYLEIELTSSAKQIEFDDIEMCNGSEEGTWNFCQWMEESPIHDDTAKPNNQCRGQVNEVGLNGHFQVVGFTSLDAFQQRFSGCRININALLYRF